jgi:cellulose synthase/poly-beta-1,6-N-acetylglucosamine synthase-like glycosyltransferase
MPAMEGGVRHVVAMHGPAAPVTTQLHAELLQRAAAVLHAGEGVRSRRPRRGEPTGGGGRTPVVPDVILPCLDEAAALPWVLRRMPAGYRPIVADNDSTDGSADVATAHGARVVQARPRGFGAACAAGLAAADDPDDVVCFLDADGSFDPQQLPRVVGPLLPGSADLVLGRRRPTQRGSWPLHARVGNAEVARQLRRRTGVAVHDLGPMRACRREALRALDLQDRRFGYPLEMVTKAAAAGWRVVEVDVDYLPRTGRSKVTGTALGTLRAVRDMSGVLRAV